MPDQQSRSRYTLEFKQEDVRQVTGRQSIASVASTLGIPKASLSNWVRSMHVEKWVVRGVPRNRRTR